MDKIPTEKVHPAGNKPITVLTLGLGLNVVRYT